MKWLTTRTPPVMDTGNQVIMQGVAQQVGSIGTGEAFEIEHLATETGQKLRFSRLALPVMVRPMLSQPQPTDTENQELRRLRLATEAIANALAKGQVVPGNLEVDGIPCMLQKNASGYSLMKINPNGTLEHICNLNRTFK